MKEVPTYSWVDEDEVFVCDECGRFVIKDCDNPSPFLLDDGWFCDECEDEVADQLESSMDEHKLSIRDLL